MFIKKPYQGIVVPLVTPLTEKFALDHAAVENIMEHIALHDCMPFILGTTGESSSIPNPVKRDYICKAAALKEKSHALYAGIGSNCLQDSIDLSKFCFDNGVNVVVATLASYYALTEMQMMHYFERLANAVPGPLMIYNIPSTTHLSIPLKVIDELSHHENVVGVKDSERSEVRLKQSLELWARRPDFSYFLGWAAKSGEALLNGCDGIVPSTANVHPGLYHKLYLAVQTGDKIQAEEMQELSDLIGNLYQSGKTLGESLAALKALMKAERLCDTYMMPPLEQVSSEEEKRLIKEYADILP